MDEAHRIAEAARASLSSFCIEECKAYCCRRGYLSVTEKEAQPILSKCSDFQKEFKVTVKPAAISISLEGDCPALAENKCSIYSERPQVCRDYPIFLEGNFLKVSAYCTGAKEGRLYPYIAEIIRLGYTLVKSNPFADFDMDIVFKKDEEPPRPETLDPKVKGPKPDPVNA